MPRLAVTVDGAPLPEEEARAFWGRFSAWMEEHKGDLAGFAKSEGLASVHPKTSREGALLVASRSAVQEPYRNAPRDDGGGRGGGGSRENQAPPTPRASHGAKTDKDAKNRG